MLRGLTDSFRQKDAQQKGVISVHYEDVSHIASNGQILTQIVFYFSSFAWLLITSENFTAKFINASSSLHHHSFLALHRFLLILLSFSILVLNHISGISLS
jgi:hypothetical protein